MKAAMSHRARRILANPTLRSMLTCIAVCVVRSISDEKTLAKVPNMKSCCE